MNPLLRFEQVRCRRGGRLLFEALDLALQPGEAVLVTGPNGSGKSSLIRLAAGLLDAEAGTVERPAAAALADDRPALDREKSLRSALSFWLQLDERPRPLDPVLDALDLTDLEEVPVRLLSTGQLKRAALARVAASGAPLWLLDEPGNGLDLRGLDRLAELIGAHLRSGGAVLAASHIPLSGGWREMELGR